MNLMEFLKKNWWAIAAICFFIGFGGKLQAIADAPASIQKTSETVEKFANSLEKYIAVQEKQKEFTEWRLKELEKRNA